MIALSVAFRFFLSRFGLVFGALGKIVSILTPIIYGAVLVYLILPIYNKTRVCITLKLKTVMESESAVGKLAETVGTLVSLTVPFAIVAGLFSVIIPQIYTSVIGLQESIGGYINDPTLWVAKPFGDNPDVQQAVMPCYEQVMKEFQKRLIEKLVPNMSMIIGQLFTGPLSVAMVMKNILIGVIAMAYLLNIKDVLATQSKKIIYSMFKLEKANRIVSEVRSVHGMFGDFTVDKPLDFLIIGIICFFALRFLGTSYVLLVSVTIGVTNAIPFFGPFIEAIPSALLILLVSPMKCLCLLIFTLILQQSDDNILGSEILGDSTRLPSLRVLFSILLFGGLMGFVGMIIGVPTFAVIYRPTSMYVSNSLVRKDLSSRTEDYSHLNHIDGEEKTYIDRDTQE